MFLDLECPKFGQVRFAKFSDLSRTFYKNFYDLCHNEYTKC